jgi:hypothetical protein
MARAIALWAFVLSGTAQAQSDDALARARTHFEAGRALYSLKNYTDAIREFSAGYQLVPRPQFLVNLGQCYDHLAGGITDPADKREKLERARDMYNKFLQDAPPSDPLRSQVAGVLVDLETKLQALPPPPPKQEPPPPKQEPPPTAAAPPPAAAPKDEAPKKKSGIARFWWLIPVAAVVVVGVSLGAYYGTRPTGPDCSSATFGCVDASKPGLIQF